GERKLLRSGDHEALQRRVRRRQDLRLLDGLREPARARETDVGKKRAPLLLVVLSVALAHVGEHLGGIDLLRARAGIAQHPGLLLRELGGELLGLRAEELEVPVAGEKALDA